MNSDQLFTYSQNTELSSPFAASAAFDLCSFWDAAERPLGNHTQYTEHNQREKSRINRRCTSFNRERKCVFKWAQATTVVSTICRMPTVKLIVDNVLVVGQGRPSLPEDRPRIVSPTSVLCSSALTPPSKYVSDEHQLSSPLSHYYDQNSNTSQLSYDNVVKPLASLEYVANRANSHDFDLDYTHLICSHNIDDFGADVAYGKNASVASSSTLGSTKLKLRPDFSFIDDIYESVKAEIGAEKACSSVQLVASSPANIAFDAPETPVITLAVDKPVTIVAEDGKEYKVVLQAVKEKANAPIRRKSSTSSNAPKVKRAPGVTLANMTIEEINERKRRQNRAAAQRYRQKQKCVKDAGKEEQDRLQKRNSYLRIEATRLQDEINGLRRQILESLANR